MLAGLAAAGCIHTCANMPLPIQFCLMRCSHSEMQSCLYSALLRILQSPEGLGVNNKRQATETLPRSIDLYTSLCLVASGT